jgi:hypothetical protein
MCPLQHDRHVSMYFSLKSWAVCLTIWITGARCMVFNAACVSGHMGIEMMPITIASPRFTGYKYSFHLALIAISHSFTFCLWFSSLLLLTAMKHKRGTKCSCSPFKGDSSSPCSALTPLPAPLGSLPPPGSP